MMLDGLQMARTKMVDAGVHPHAVAVFCHYYAQLRAGATGIVAEGDLEPVAGLPHLRDVSVDDDACRRVLGQTVVLKLNGGLGTSMGLDRAKSLIPVRGDRTFIDIVVGQVLALRDTFDVPLPLVFMDSFRTRQDTLAALERHADLAVPGIPLDFVQNQEPKLRSDDLTPIDWPADPALEWCPPGHGDLYTALESSGTLQCLLDGGFRYAFVSNADNLGARPDAHLAAWFADSGSPFAVEFCRRTEADRKGGHLARRRADGQFVLRESAQTSPEDTEAFGDIDRHRFFNTNNLWLDLHVLQQTLRDQGSILGLPLIRNVKTVDPADPTSPEVVQVETAMGAAIGVFPGATAIEVDRTRFLPVKTTSDLLVMRSDAYRTGEDAAVCLAEGRDAAPLVQLDANHRLLGDFERSFPHGPPSLLQCERLAVEGEWTFGRDVAVVGDVHLDPPGGTIADGQVLAG